MKTSIAKLGLALLTCVFALSSCNNDEKPTPAPTPTPDPKPTTATIIYTMPNRLELVKYADMTVKYTDAAGKEISEVVKTATWTKTITNVPVPGTYKMSISYVRNKTALDKEEYNFVIGSIVEYTTSKGAYDKRGDIIKLEKVEKAKMDECFTSINELDHITVDIK